MAAIANNRGQGRSYTKSIGFWLYGQFGIISEFENGKHEMKTNKALQCLAAGVCAGMAGVAAAADAGMQYNW